MTQQTLNTPHVCDYPGCENPAEPTVPGTSTAAPRFCADPDHNPLNLFRRFRARRQQKNAGVDKAIVAADTTVVAGDDNTVAAQASTSASWLSSAPAPEELELAVPIAPEAVEQAQDKISMAVAVAKAAATDAPGEAHYASREKIVELIGQLSALLPSYIEELASITDSETAESRIAAVTRVAARQSVAAEQRALIAEAAADLAIQDLDTARKHFSELADQLRQDTARQEADGRYAKDELERARERIALLEVRIDEVRAEADTARRALAALGADAAREAVLESRSA
ncbi:hypothetical protein ABH926_008732 [Catenulispora sp. GP43]|uniref:hypothetical protein n=1 Tax=Catenulispora sp. GP43 TaxID=3156263 RepID=UPI0035161E33